jgi:chaperonin GroES
MAHDRGCPRGAGNGGFTIEGDAVDRVQYQAFGFDAHGADGTVVSVSGADSKLPIKMLNDRLLVRIPREDGERKTSGGILIPATAQVAKRLVWAEVMGVGQNVRTVQVGDQVLFAPEDRYEVEVRGDDYLILRERDIHAVAAERVEGSTGLYL